MANILFLVHRLPYPPDKGDKVRSFQLLRALQRQGHRVFLGTFVDDPADRRHLDALRAQCPDLRVVELDKGRARLRALGSLLRREPLTLGYFRDAALRAWVDELAATQPLDLTLAVSSAMVQYAPPGVPLLVDFVDLDSAKWARFAPQHRWPLSWIYSREARVLLGHERRSAGLARHAFFVTPQELAGFEQRAPECRGRASVLGNGVDAAYFAPADGRANPFGADELPLVFTGSMDYWPNVDAVGWFVREMLPRCRAAEPRLRFYIVGRNPTRRVQALAGEAVVVTGALPDVRPYLQHAAAVVAPMRFASGMQNKVLEAMAMAQIVLTTPACAAAVGADVSQGLLRAADAEGFVQALTGLLRRSAAELQALRQAARQYMLEHFQWEDRLRPLEHCLAGTVQGRAVA